jgi:transketolase
LLLLYFFLPPGACYKKVALGGYTVKEVQSPNGASLPHPTLVLIGTGTELALALQVAQALLAKHEAAGKYALPLFCC